MQRPQKTVKVGCPWEGMLKTDKLVEIPKKSGGKRGLGIPTVSDRIAQMTVKQYIEPRLEAIFHTDSYGYRPNKSATEAIGQARKRVFG